MLFSLMLNGCFTTSLVAPENASIRIMAEKEKAHYQTEIKDWYILAGLVPIYRHDLAALIKEEKLVEIRVRTEDRISDGLITFASEMLAFIFPVFPQSLVVEGNTAEHATMSPSTTTNPNANRNALPIKSHPDH